MDQNRRLRDMAKDWMTVLMMLGLALPVGAVARERCTWPEAMPVRALVLVGEVHGTVETPALVGELACAASADGTAVTVALEISAREQARLDAYLASAGTPAARAALLAGPFWTRSTQDGRSSTAMLALLERLRRLNADGRRIAVIAVDEERIGSRDVGMAEHITRAVQPGRRVIALLGNVHASQRLGRPNLPDYAPAGYLLRGLAPLGVRVGAHGGEAWVCAPVCGVRAFGNQRVGDASVGYAAGDRAQSGYDGNYTVPLYTASLPAIGVVGQAAGQSPALR